MDEQRFTQLIEQLNEYEGVEEVFMLNVEGEIIFKSTSIAPLTSEEAKALLSDWKEKKPSLNYQNSRYAILKNDDIQLAAKNIAGGKGNIAGSITKEGDFLIAHIAPDTGMILLEWSILVNKISWS